MLNVKEFWNIADETRLETEYRVDEKLQFLQTASLEALQKICLQYRYFTKEFPDNLGVLLSKVPHGNFKSLIGEIVSEELGEGNPERAHLRLYDNFLVSIGISKDVLESSLYDNNENLLSEISQLTLTQSKTYGIGLVGMGGECLCQIYLSNMYDNLVKNPYIQKHKKSIDWEFWNFHVGEADIIHRQKVRQAINEVVNEDESSVNDLASGYLKAKHNWDTFWHNNYEIAMLEAALV